MFCRLQRPNNCPNNGTRSTDCKECRSNFYKEAGNTTYTKIRIDLTSLKVISKYTSTTFDYFKKPKRLFLNWCYGLIKAKYAHSLFPFILANSKFMLLLKRAVIIKHTSPVSILANDSTFTTGSYGKTIPFATAGDCYSSQGNCPQVCYTVLSWQIQWTHYLIYRETFFCFKKKTKKLWYFIILQFFTLMKWCGVAPHL